MPVPADDVQEASLGVPKNRNALAGIAVGLLASLSWALYNVGIEIGRADGFSAADLAFLRYLVPTLILVPLLARKRDASPGRLTIVRALVLSFLIGPVFALFTNTGYGIAPLAHALVISPGTTMVSANLFARVFGGRPIPVHRIIGIMILMAGLLVIAADKAPSKDIDSGVWLGDLYFFVSGILWGAFTYLMGKWELAPVPTTAAVSAISLLAFLPIYILYFGVGDMPAIQWLEQSFYQGLLGGCVALLAYVFAITLLGPGPAAIFPAIVPPFAVLLSIPMILQWPNAWQCAGVLLASTGLIVSLDTVRAKFNLWSTAWSTSGQDRPKE